MRGEMGSYVTCAPTSNVAVIDADLSCGEPAAATPETCTTALTYIQANLQIDSGQLLVVSGATASLGQTAARVVVDDDPGIIVTTHSRKRFAMLAVLGVERCELEGRCSCSPTTFRAVAPLPSMRHILFNNSIARSPPAVVREFGRRGFLMPAWIFDGWTELGEAAAKACMMYVVALVGLRVANRRTLAQLTAIDFAAAVAIGAIIGRTAVAEQSFAVGAAALVAILLAHWAATLGRFHPLFMRMVDHRVRVLIDHGRVRRDQLRLCGLTEGEVLARLRQMGVRSLDELRYVLYEAKGEFTLVRENGAGEADSELVSIGLEDAAGQPERARPRRRFRGMA